MRDGLTTRQLAATMLAGMAVPLTLRSAQMHWRWVLLALLAAALYYYIMYRKKRTVPLTELTVSAYGKAGKPVLWAAAIWLLWLSGYVAKQSVNAFPQTTGQPLTGLLLLGIASWAAKKGTSAVARCGALLILLLGVLYGIVLIFIAPQVQLRWLAPYGTWKQSIGLFPLLTVPSLLLYFKPDQNNTKPLPWLAVGGILALAASIITAGCLSPRLAAEQMSFYTLSRSVSLFGTMERFEALISAACLTGYFCLMGLMLCAAKEIMQYLLVQVPEKRILIFLPSAVAAVVSTMLPTTVFVVGTAIFSGVFPLVTQEIGRLKKP